MARVAAAFPMAGPQASERLRFELGRRVRADGVNIGQWPGLAICRFTQSIEARWNAVERLSVAILVPAGDRRPVYAVIGGGSRLDCRILKASCSQPVLGLLLEIDPQVVRSVSASMGGPRPAARYDGEPALSVIDVEMTDTVVRFLESLSTGADRHFLAPLRLQEIIYRMLQRDQRSRLEQLAASLAVGGPVAEALDYIDRNLAEPLSVEILAAQVCLSASAFSRVFRQVTDRSPYQYVKEKRLDHARRFFDDGRVGVADVSRSVGYRSVSHFIKEFRNQFGVTPGGYAEMRTRQGGLHAVARAGPDLQTAALSR